MTTSTVLDLRQLTPQERKLLALVAQKQERTINSVEKLDDGIYIRGTRRFGQVVADSNGYLQVMAIDLIDWTLPTWAGFTDYPGMARDGDWSAIRDTHNLRPMVEAVLKHLAQTGLI